MSNKEEKLPVFALVLIVLMFIMSIGSLISGALLFLSPGGKAMGMSTEMLSGTIFPNFLVPGIVLFIFLGIFPMLVGIGLIHKSDWRWARALNPFPAHHWTWTASIAVGIITLFWMIIELSLVGYISLLQPLVLLWGVVFLLLTTVPSVRKHYHVKKPTD